MFAAISLSALFFPSVSPAAWSTWTQWNTNGFGNTNNYSVFELEVYNDNLYAGTHNITQGCEIWRYDGPNPSNWTELTDGGFSDSHTHPLGHFDTHTVGYAHTERHADTHAQRHADTFVDTNAFGHTHSNHDPDPHAHDHTISGRGDLRGADRGHP